MHTILAYSGWTALILFILGAFLIYVVARKDQVWGVVGIIMWFIAVLAVLTKIIGEGYHEIALNVALIIFRG